MFVHHPSPFLYIQLDLCFERIALTPTRAISMVHARTFSFTDDSINVVFPASLMGPPTLPPSPTPALLLFQLRRAQSYWYQELYQTHSGAPLHDPTSFVWQMCLEMREWGESLPRDLPPAIRHIFDQELLYSYVYCIAPSSRAPDITDYSRHLIFEYSVAYLDSMHATARDDRSLPFYSYHDALKVYFMANQLLAVLVDAENMLLTGPQPLPPPPAPRSRAPGAPPPPPPVPPQRVGPGYGGVPASNLDRSIGCLERVDQTLAKFGERWEESAMLKLSFERISGDTTDRLRQRRDGGLDMSQQHQQQQHGMPPVDVSWGLPNSNQPQPRQ